MRTKVAAGQAGDTLSVATKGWGENVDAGGRSRWVEEKEKKVEENDDRKTWKSSRAGPGRAWTPKTGCLGWSVQEEKGEERMKDLATWAGRVEGRRPGGQGGRTGGRPGGGGRGRRTGGRPGGRVGVGRSADVNIVDGVRGERGKRLRIWRVAAIGLGGTSVTAVAAVRNSR